MSSVISTGAGNFTINAEAANDVQTTGGLLRLLCRPSHAQTLRPVWVMDSNQAPTAAGDGAPVNWLRDLVEHRPITPERCLTETSKRFAGDSIAVAGRNTASGFRQGGIIDLFSGSWTLDLELASGFVNSAGYVANLRTVAATDAGKVFDVYWNGIGTRTFTINFYSYSAPTLTTYSATLDASAWTFSNNKFYDFRLTFDRTNQLFKAEIREPDTDNRVTVTKTGVASVNSPTGFDAPPLILGGILTDGGAQGTTLASGATLLTIQRAYLYASFLDTGLFAISARPTFYAATTAGDGDGVSAYCTLDSGRTASTWDMSTLTADDIAQFASALSGGGWEVAYEISESATPATWSSWMTWTALKAESDAAGRYLHIGLRATSNGYDAYYPIAYISGTATLTTESSPGVPVLNSGTNDETGTSITMNVTPPASGTYDTIEFYYRVIHGTSWTSGGSYVGTPETAGDHQITGLSNGLNYEVYCYAQLGSSSGVPSAILRVKCSSSTAPVQEQIVDDVISALETITTGNGYHQTLNQVHRVKDAIEPYVDAPMVDVLISGETNQDEEINGSYGITTRDLELSLWAYVKDMNDPDQELSYIQADVEKALLADVHRGQLAQNTIVNQVSRIYLNRNDNDYTGAISIRVTVRYQHRLTDPYETR